MSLDRVDIVLLRDNIGAREAAMRFSFGTVSLLYLLAGCTDYGPGQVAPPNAISVTKAFEDVGNGLASFRRIVDASDAATGQPQKLGVVTCRIIVRFNISASANQTGQLGATFAVPVQAFNASVNAQAAEAAAAARGNVVLVQLQAAIRAKVVEDLERQGVQRREEGDVRPLTERLAQAERVV